MKKQISVAEKQYEKFDNVFESNKMEEKIERSRTSNLVYNNCFTFYKYRNINKFAKRSFYSKQNDLIEFKEKLETFYYDTEEIKSNNEAQEKDLEKRKAVIDNCFNFDKTQYNKLSEDLKKRVDILNKPEVLILDFDKNVLTQMSLLENDQEEKLEP